MNCRYCEKQLATQADYDAIPENEGEHLCWSDFGQPCIGAEKALDIARDRIAELVSILANFETHASATAIQEVDQIKKIAFAKADTRIDIHDIPARPQRQDSTAEQMADLVAVANRLGMYDAADAVQQMAKNLPSLRYGCHCDLEPHMEPDGCVIDEGRPQDCIYAKPGMRKEQCKYWRVIKANNMLSVSGERKETNDHK